MELSGKQKSHLRGLAHNLHAMVQVGRQGLTPNMVKEINRCLADHELIKIKMEAEDQDEFQSETKALVEKVGAALVQTIGHTVVLYREGDDPKITLP